MTKHEKWTMTLQRMQLVRRHYLLLRSSCRHPGAAQRRLRALEPWLTVVDRTILRLKDRRGKSGARARQDWLIARTIEMLIYENAEEEQLRLYLTGQRALSLAYVRKLAVQAALALQEEADSAGLFDRIRP